MKTNKQIKMLLMSVTIIVVVLFSLNFITLMTIVHQDGEINKLKNQISDTVDNVDKNVKNINKVDGGLMKVYEMIEKDFTPVTLHALIEELVYYGYIEPIEEWITTDESDNISR